MDLSVSYLGLDLQHPIIASASPLSQSIDGIKRLEEAGAAAVVLPSLFEEQVRTEAASLLPQVRCGTTVDHASTSNSAPVSYENGPDEYLELVRKAKKVVQIPVIASLNGATPGGWTQYARCLAEAGASAIELNIYSLPTDLWLTGRQVESQYEEIVQSVRRAVSIPLAVKSGPFFSAMGEMAQRLVAAGADGLVLFNRFYQPDFDLDHLQVVPSLELSRRSEIRLPLLWIAVLHGRLQASLAASSGVHTSAEVVKYLLAGADAVMTASALMRNGLGHMKSLVNGLREWLEQHDFGSVRQIQGLMDQRSASNPGELTRTNYMRVLQSYWNPYLA